MKVFYNPKFIVTTKASEPFRGKDQDQMEISYEQSIIEENGIIKSIVSNRVADSYIRDNKTEVIDCSDMGILPGFVDPHTHILYSGNRTEEFYQRIRGESYLDILKKGNGILKTVRDTRGKTSYQILEDSMSRIRQEIRNGVTCMEVKSGYGLDLNTEKAILQAAVMLKTMDIIDVITTYLGMHSIPPELDGDHYTDFVIEKVLPEISKMADFGDCFCDEGAFSPEQTDKFFDACDRFGIKIRVHSDEISNLGCLKLSSKHRIISADHLLKTDINGIETMRRNGVIATLLPITAFSLNEKFANARNFIDRDVPVALGTDCSPLSPIPNMLFAIHLAVKNCGMTCNEAINSATINSAASLGLLHRMGTIEPGKKANFSIFNINDPSELPYRWGDGILRSVFRNGIEVC